MRKVTAVDGAVYGPARNRTGNPPHVKRMSWPFDYEPKISYGQFGCEAVLKGFAVPPCLCVCPSGGLKFGGCLHQRSVEIFKSPQGQTGWKPPADEFNIVAHHGKKRLYLQLPASIDRPEWANWRKIFIAALVAGGRAFDREHAPHLTSLTEKAYRGKIKTHPELNALSVHFNWLSTDSELGHSGLAEFVGRHLSIPETFQNHRISVVHVVD